ncbi:MAG: hypothetical protein R2862_08715 [Thermoanaerobaculia bacterium]
MKDTALLSRIGKNISLIALEGNPAPEVDFRDTLGPEVRSLAELRGRPVLLFSSGRTGAATVVPRRR